MRKLSMWIAWHLPLKIVLWCVVRAFAIATTTKYTDLTPDEITYTKLWEALGGDWIMQ